MAANSYKADLWGGLLWLLLGIGVCLESTRLGLGRFQKPAAGFMPFLSGGVLALCGAILLLYNLCKWLNKKRNNELGEVSCRTNWMKFVRDWKNFLFTLLALFGYGLLLDVLGFSITTFLFLFFMFKLPETKRWFMPLVTAGIVVTVSYFLFVVWLGCQFPKGIFR